MKYRNIIISGCGGLACRLWRAGGAEGQVSCAERKNTSKPATIPKARVALRNVLKIDPKDADALLFYLHKSRRRKKTGATPCCCIKKWYSLFLIHTAAIDYPWQVLSRSPSDRASRLNGRQRCWRKIRSILKRMPSRLRCWLLRETP